MLNGIFVAIALSPALVAGAQSLIVQFADTADCAKSVISYGNGKGLSRYDVKAYGLPVDEKGVFTTDSVRMNDGMDFCPAWLYIGRERHSFIYQPGTPLEIKVGKGGTVSFEGANAAASRYFDDYEKTFDFDNYYIYPPENDTVSMAEKQKRLDADYARIRPQLASLPEGDVRDFLAQLTEDAYLNYCIRFADKEHGRELLKNVDMNSWIGLYNYLPAWAFEAALPEPDYDKDMTAWGIQYLDSVKAKISEPAVRDNLLDACAKYVLAWGKCLDVDAFWNPLVALAGEGSPVVKEYTDLAASLKHNKAGVQAPDFSFKDRDGNSHKLSDYFGKLLYIDCWASWCGPCRKEIPHIERHYKEHYKDNDKICFISISVDEDRDAWLRIIDKDKPEWPQFIASGDEYKALAKAYGIMGIPRFILIAADGTIVNADAFRPSDEDFRDKIDKLLGDK